MRKSKSEVKAKRNLKKDDVLYPRFLTPNTYIHIVDGNDKVGKGIYCVNLLPGCTYLFLSDGTQLTNVKGTCEGCGEICEKDGCYAVRDAKYHHNSCIPAWVDNTLLVRFALEAFLEQWKEHAKRCFRPVYRIHSTGEFESYEHYKKVADMLRDNPEMFGYTYTKREEWVNRYIEENHLEEYVRKHHKIYQNFVVLISRWNEWNENKYGLPIFVFDDGTNPELKNKPHCPAVDENGEKTGETCSHCKSCLKALSKAVYDHSSKGRMKAKARAKKFTETHPFIKE